MLFRRLSPPSADEIAASSTRGLERLSSLQLEDGSFPFTFVSPAGECRPCHPLFSTVTVLLAVGGLLTSDAREAACRFVARQRRDDGLWRFGPGDELPPDSDDTACALASICLHGGYVPGTSDANVLRRFWRDPDGPFQTWIGAPAEWMRIDRDDAVVNFNVLLALRVLGSPPTAAERRAAIALANKTRKATRYYCSPLTTAYAARRAGMTMSDLHPALIAPPPRRNIQAVAQRVIALGEADPRSLRSIIDNQNPGGGWSAEDWCRGINGNAWKSEAVTSALCLEALATD